jgi:hypothetical protein
MSPSPPNALAKLQRDQIGVCGAAANNQFLLANVGSEGSAAIVFQSVEICVQLPVWA